MNHNLYKMIVYDKDEKNTLTLLLNSLKTTKNLMISYIRDSLLNIKKLNNYRVNIHNDSNTNKLFNQTDEGIIIINRLGYKDNVCYESKLAIKVDVGTNKAIKIYEQNRETNENCEFNFSVFLGTDIENINGLTIKGYIEAVDYSESIIKLPFNCAIDQNYLNKARKPAYWIDIDVKVPRFKIRKKSSFKLYIQNITIDRIKKDEINELYISKIRSSADKPVMPQLLFVLSLDGITSEDINIKDSNGSLVCPTIKQFQSQSISYENSYCSSSVTASSASSLLTGLGLSRHFMYDYTKTTFDLDLKILSPELTNVPELLKMNGYDCFGITAFSKWRPHYGHSRGFDHFKNFSSGKYHMFPYLKQTIEFISNCTKRSSFVLSHLPLPHPPLNNRVSSIGDDPHNTSYYNTLSETDLTVKSIIGFIKELGVFDSSMIILIADHGRSLPPYTRFNYQFNEERLRVPFMVKLPEENNHSFQWSDQINDPISATTSIFEIILDLTNIEKPSYFHELSKRKYGKVTWVSETVDYEIEPVKSFGIVGYDSEYKWVLYFDFDNVHNKICKLEKIIANPLNNKGYADDSINIINSLDRNRIDSVISEANEYIRRGKEFTKENPNISLDEASILQKIL
tara:strand:+ start:1490 stop:3370 length:1881 start_codon:yes stop_codon:yes gene_type:complete